jgi:hypothetical protein
LIRRPRIRGADPACEFVPQPVGLAALIAEPARCGRRAGRTGAPLASLIGPGAARTAKGRGPWPSLTLGPLEASPPVLRPTARGRSSPFGLAAVRWPCGARAVGSRTGGEPPWGLSRSTCPLPDRTRPPMPPHTVEPQEPDKPPNQQNPCEG